MQKLRRILPLFALLAFSAACGDTGPTGPTNAAESTLVATVTADGSALPGVTVQLFAESGSVVLETATTDDSGRVSFTDLIAGTYDIQISVPAGYAMAGDGSDRQSITVEKNAEATVTFELVAT